MMALVGNKCDIPAEKVRIPMKEALDMANRHNMIWAEVSAKSGEGIETLFNKVSEKIFEIKKKEQQQN